MSAGKASNLKATIAFGIASFATSGINYIFTPVFTELLSTEEYGLVSVYNAIYAIISVIATLTLIKPGLLSVGMYEHKENRWRYLSSMLGLVAASSIVTGGVIFAAWGLLRSVINLPAPLMVLMILTCALNPAVVFWTYKQKYEYNYKVTFFVTVGTAVAAQLVSVGAVIAMRGRGVDLGVVRLWSAGAVNLSVAAVLAVYIFSKGKRPFDRALWRGALIFALPLIPHYLGFAFLNGTDKLMIDSMVGTDKAGIYSLAATISTVGSLLWTALCVTFTPFVNEQLGRKNYGSIRKNTNTLLTLIGIFCVIVTLLAPEVIMILGTDEYMEGVYVVPATVAGVFMHIVYDAFAHVSFFHKRSVRIMLATITAAVTNVVLNYVFINAFGYVAASYTTLISFIVLALMHYGNVRAVEKEKIFDARVIALLSIIVTLACLSCSLLYGVRIARYMIALALFAYVVIDHRRYVGAITDMKV